ncbi:MAG TPA: carbohydrate ABC transporter permease [Candidatus Dormibacteraeota bacterium]|nr:carbohydrate ABC transporter permease [Candidatus Dormibacteraeota bacterium]
MSAVGSRTRPVNLRKLRRNVLVGLAFLFYLFIALIPIWWMVRATFVADYDLIDLTVNPFWFRQPLSLVHITYLFEHTRFLTWYGNTYLVAFCVVLITLVLCVPASYGLARLRFRGAEGIGIAVFMSYLIPPILLFLPLNQIVNNLLQLPNSKWAMVAVYPTFTVPFCLWLLIGFFKRVPIELEEAAVVDGASRWQAVWQVVLPLTVPGILTAAIFAFTLSMQDFLYALTFASSSSQKVLNTGVPTELIRGDLYFWGELMTAALLAGVPVAILYNFFLDHFVEGITGALR